MANRAQNVTNVWIKYELTTGDVINTSPVVFQTYFDPPESISGKRCRMSLTSSRMVPTDKNDAYNPCILSISGLSQPYNKRSEPGIDRMDQSGFIAIIDTEHQQYSSGPEILTYVQPGPQTLTFTISKTLPFTIHGSTKTTFFVFCLSFEPIE